MGKSSVLFGIIAFFICFNGNMLSIHSEASSSEMQVHFIDVGQGDSMLIKTPGNKNILIDGGPPDAGKKVVSYLNEKKIDKIDLLVATHPDVDHIGGLPYIMKHIKVKKILDSGKLHTTRMYAKYIQEIRKQEIPVKVAKQNEKILLDSAVDIQVLNTYKKSRSNNQSSIALKMSYEAMDILFMSDVEIEQEKEIMKNVDVDAEVIKVGHHGSNTSTSLKFLKAVSPDTAILTYSKDNDYGHPVDRVINNLYRVNANIYSTGALGNLVIRTDGEDYLVLPEREPLYNLDAS
ncbi:ComEC/Rec2 family competence protein [Virgibacillus salexigens]|uniref:ComEC family competence protein n=1 Tax=Virgibacillus massiliensis TaxID=1462526 RepID=A0A024QHV0_9BACI|nr:ComEC/Rec2 family competence protein [Virgibacillus massiliensis]CDQ42074.1 ComEC family competence protein [Virgibacillus massiliensis]